MVLSFWKYKRILKRIMVIPFAAIIISLLNSCKNHKHLYEYNNLERVSKYIQYEIRLSCCTIWVGPSDRYQLEKFCVEYFLPKLGSLLNWQSGYQWLSSLPDKSIFEIIFVVGELFRCTESTKLNFQRVCLIWLGLGKRVTTVLVKDSLCW